jgi:hypothetical protein
MQLVCCDNLLCGLTHYECQSLIDIHCCKRNATDTLL